MRFLGARRKIIITEHCFFWGGGGARGVLDNFRQLCITGRLERKIVHHGHTEQHFLTRHLERAYFFNSSS